MPGGRRTSRTSSPAPDDFGQARHASGGVAPSPAVPLCLLIEFVRALARFVVTGPHPSVVELLLVAGHVPAKDARDLLALNVRPLILEVEQRPELEAGVRHREVDVLLERLGFGLV